ncbi:MAG: dihydropteroate synthase [Acidobacteriota bacterium]
MDPRPAPKVPAFYFSLNMPQADEKKLFTSRRIIELTASPLVMGILNVTPDSFSDGGRKMTVDDALRAAEQMVEEGVDIIDIGGESTRPAASKVSADEETARTQPVIEALAKRFDVPISIDTTKSDVASAALNSGAEIVNDISGLRFDPDLASVVSSHKAALVLMHLRGTFETMHSQEPVDEILPEVISGLRTSIGTAMAAGIESSRMVIDIGIGFSKTVEQNLELIARLDEICDAFPGYPMLVGASRKSFIGRILDDAPSDKRLYGTLAAHLIALWNGADILRVHDVREAVESLRVVAALKTARQE